MTWRIGLSTLITAAVLSACNCGPGPTRPDASVDEDAGFDAGEEVPDSGEPVPDAGQPDAGPAPMLKITKVLPPRGPTGGGTSVTIEGSAFLRNFSTTGSDAKRVTTLKFGSNPVIDYVIIDDQTMEVRSPAGSTGTATISIKNPNGTFLCNSCFTYYDELVLSQASPKEGPLRGGNVVALEGQGFTNDVEVLFGGQASPDVTFVSPQRLDVVVPRGVTADLVDISVYNKNGVGVLRRQYRYFADLRVTSVAPATSPINVSTTNVVITGTGFTGATALKFGALDATGYSVDSDTQISVAAPSAPTAGSVDISVTTPRDAFVAKNAFTYFDPVGAFALFSIYPHVAWPGQQVTLTGQALNAGGLTVTLGGVPATVGARTFSTAVVTVPPRGAATRKSDVVANAATLPAGFTWRLAVATVAPDNGPAAGGTAAMITGTALPTDAEVFVGALKSTGVTVASETMAALVTPKGSGGQPNDVWVREAADPENEAVLAAAYTFNEPLSIGRVQPERGAIAGNTLVTVLGAGFGVGNFTGTLVKFGPNVAKDIKVIDQHTLTCRTPKGDVGTVDVTVERLGPSDVLQGGFSYFDPRSISGGLSGGPLTGTLNITVLDSTQSNYGAPVPLADVILGIDPSTPFQGRTDARGQITFSDPSLVKAQTVTVYKENYESATVTAVNAENLTVFIAQTGGGDPSPAPPPPGVPPSTISGRVTGFKAPRALISGETLEARVFVAQTSLYAGPPFRGPPNRGQEKWQVVVDGGEYLVFTGAGLHAVYAIMGVANRGLGSFTPYLMGVRRGVTTSPDVPAINQHIILDSYLDLTVPITIDGPLTIAGLPATNTVYAFLDLGAEGFVPNPNNWATGTGIQSSASGMGSSLSFAGFPRLDGSNFIFMNLALGQGATDPYSLYFRRQPGDMSLGVTIGPLLPPPEIVSPMGGTFNGTISWTLPPGPTANILQVQVQLPTLFGPVTLWSIVLPGTETQVVLPPPAVTKLRNEQMGQMLTVSILASRSPKFSYNQWTYDTLSGVTWSSFTVTDSDPFTP